MKINFKKRLENKQFLVAIFSSLLLASQAIANLFGYDISNELGDKLTYAFNTVLSVLVISGIVVDPTSSGFSDKQDNQTK